MITDAIGNMVMGLLSTLLGVFPTWSPPSTSIAPLVGYLSSVDAVLPVGTILLVLGATLALSLALLTVRVVVFLYRLIPFKFS